MSHEHTRLICEKCPTVISQCRCIEPKLDVKKGLCSECAVKLWPIEFHYKDKVRFKIGFYKGETGELTGLSDNRYCVTLDRDGKNLFVESEIIHSIVEKI